jgi:hypothetical protein
LSTIQLLDFLNLWLHLKIWDETVINRPETDSSTAGSVTGQMSVYAFMKDDVYLYDKFQHVLIPKKKEIIINL